MRRLACPALLAGLLLLAGPAPLQAQGEARGESRGSSAGRGPTAARATVLGLKLGMPVAEALAAGLAAFPAATVQRRLGQGGQGGPFLAYVLLSTTVSDTESDTLGLAFTESGQLWAIERASEFDRQRAPRAAQLRADLRARYGNGGFAGEQPGPRQDLVQSISWRFASRSAAPLATRNREDAARCIGPLYELFVTHFEARPEAVPGLALLPGLEERNPGCTAALELRFATPPGEPEAVAWLTQALIDAGPRLAELRRIARQPPPADAATAAAAAETERQQRERLRPRL